MTDFSYHAIAKKPDEKTMGDLHQLLNDVLFKLTTSTFEELVRNSGMDVALIEMKPFVQQNAVFVSGELKKRGVIHGNGPEVLLTCWMFASACVTDKIHGEIREQGAVGYTYDCIFKNGGTPEQCIVISHFSTEHLCQLINPEYECIFTHHVTNGDPYCRYVFKKKTELHGNLDDLGDTLAIIPDFQIGPDERMMMRRWMLSSNWKMVTEAFVKVHGSEKATEILTANALKIGNNIGKQLLEKQIIKDIDIRSVGSFLDLLGTIFNQKGAFTINNPTELSKEITDCPLQTMNIEICRQIEALFQGISSALDPSLKFHYEKMITNNDKSCYWILRKSSELREKLEEESTSLDPASILAIRYAKGELSEEEFDSRMAKLRKHGLAN